MDWTKIIAPAVDFIGQQLTNHQNRSFQREMWDKQTQYNTSERIAAQEYNTSERIATQDYNAPVNQMARLQLAGINPNSAANMVSGAPSSPQSIQGASAVPQFSDMPSPFGDIFAAQQAYNQAKLIGEQAKGQEIENKYKDENLRLTNKQIEQGVKVAKADESYKKAITGLSASQKAQIDNLLPIAMREGEAKIDQFEAQAKLFLQQIEESKKKVQKLGSEMDLISAQTGKVQQETKNLTLEEFRLEWENDCRRAGLDPNSDFGTNLMMMMYAHPDGAQTLVDNAFKAIKTGLKTIDYHLPFSPSKYAAKPFEHALNRLGGGFFPLGQLVPMMWNMMFNTPNYDPNK